MTPHTYIFIGRSGGGKGTQAKLLMEYLKEKDSMRDIAYIYTGDKIRAFIQGTSYAAKRAKIIQESGGRQPSFLAVYMWSKVFTGEEFKGTEHIVFDGTPRSLSEAEMLDTALEFFERNNVHIIFVDVSREWATERLLARKRSDDTREAINARLDYFDKDVAPALEYYRSHPKHTFCAINGEQTIEAVHQEILQKISE